MKKEYSDNKAITLIALVVTIIVLIILAGISMNLLLGENGIIIKAQEAKNVQEINQVTEVLELKKVDVAAYNENGAVPIDKYIEEIQNTDKMQYKVTRIR